MIRNYLPQTMLMALLLLGCGSVMGQDKPPAVAKPRPMVEAKRNETPSDGTFRLLWSKLNVDFRKVVTGAPYSAIAVSEHTQTLSDGNQIIRKSAASYYRDSQGRLRTERKLDNLGNWTATGDAPQLIMIADPVIGRSYTLDPGTRTGRVDPYATSARVSTAAANAELAAATRELAAASNQVAALAAEVAALAPAGKAAAVNAKLPTTAVAPKEAAKPKQPDPAAAPSRARGKKESLGKQMMEGIEVEGTRTTQTIPAGEIGNTLPIRIVDESWYSPELQLRVMIVHRDPRSGESTFRLTNINRSEPARTLFEVPDDYRMEEGMKKPSKTAAPG